MKRGVHITILTPAANPCDHCPLALSGSQASHKHSRNCQLPVQLVLRGWTFIRRRRRCLTMQEKSRRLRCVSVSVCSFIEVLTAAAVTRVEIVIVHVSTICCHMRRDAHTPCATRSPPCHIMIYSPILVVLWSSLFEFMFPRARRERHAQNPVVSVRGSFDSSRHDLHVVRKHLYNLLLVVDRIYSLLCCAVSPTRQLHAHLHGCIRPATLTELAAARGLASSEEQQRALAPGGERSLSDCFKIFDAIHA